MRPEHLARRFAQARAERVELDVALSDSGMRSIFARMYGSSPPGADDAEPRRGR